MCFFFGAISLQKSLDAMREGVRENQAREIVRRRGRGEKWQGQNLKKKKKEYIKRVLFGEDYFSCDYLT